MIWNDNDVREKLKKHYQDLESWTKVGELFNISESTVRRYAIGTPIKEKYAIAILTDQKVLTPLMCETCEVYDECMKQVLQTNPALCENNDY